jgi:hypothetical protein
MRPTQDEPRCYCGTKPLDPDDATYVLRGVAICNNRCFKKAEEEQLRRVAAAAGRVHSPWFIGIAAILAVFMLTQTFTTKARAHDPNTHLANDLANAKSKIGGLCCNGKDYHLISTWERTDQGYRIHFGGQWVDLPKEAEVDNMHNPDGEAKAWVVFDEGGTPYVRCFMRGIES